ncbi:SpoIIE family protein phosphatase [Nocardioides zeae]|uniref:SpoIIE family protein phosphatase n=1 Tax=Nocardioides imazamoxiresistens TaxID=3231893 RepID=A0ABU3Q052_9ACTN|nr:SpoIIE family protein phosphatase [Nocardioides zeae]MDT9594417.1 SpoIIE family protein phosphatase [Nocardioides zeae]
MSTLSDAGRGYRRDHEALLAQLGEVLGSVHRPTRALELLVDAFVDTVADFAQVALRGGQGWIAVGRTAGHQVVGVDDHAVGRRRAEAIRDLLARRTAEHWVLPPDTPERIEVLGNLFGATPLVEQLDSLDAVSLLHVPLVARGRALGILTLARRGPEDFTPEEIGALEDVAGRVGTSLDVSVVVADNRHVASVLRTALLPPPLPSAHDLDVASYNRVAQEDVTVGGDFIDLHGTDEDLTMLLGDAVGKGVAAAVAAKRIRSSVRTAALVDRSPDRVLDLTNRVLVTEVTSPIESFATAVCGRLRRLEDGAYDVTLTNAGHPPPIILRRSGRLEYVESHGPALGVFEDAEYGSSTHRLEIGDILVCYTDGITEARGRADMFGEDGIANALAGLGGAPSSAVVERLAMSVSSFMGVDSLDRDDAAILAVRPTGV